MIVFTRKQFEKAYGEKIPNWMWDILRRNYLEMQKKDTK